MAKKLILLLLIIPIVVMLILFAASDTVAILVDVHVEKVKITNNPGYIILDFDQDETFSFEYVVTPTGAKNDDVAIRLEKIDDEPLAEFMYDMQDGKITITPTKVGYARVIVYSLDDDTRKDSFEVRVKTTKLQSIDATISRDVLVLGGEEGADTATITTTFFPENPSNTTLYYKSSNEEVVTVSAAGIVRAVGRGDAIITVTSDADAGITDTVDVVVEMEGTMAAATPKPSSQNKGDHYIDFVYPVEFNEDNLTYRVLDKNGQEIADPSSVITGRFEIIDKNIGKQRVKFSYEFAADYVGDVTIEFIIEIDGETESLAQTFSKVDKIGLSYDKSVIGVSADNKEGFSLYFEVIPSDIPVELGEVAISNSALISGDVTTGVVDGDVRLTLKTLGKAGTVTVSLTVYNKLDPTDYATFEKTIEIGVTDIRITHDTDKVPKVEDSLEKLLTIGGYEYSGTTLVNTVFSLIATPKSGELLAGNENYYKDHYKWYSSSDKVKIDEKTGLITYTEDAGDAEIVKFWVSYVYGDKEIKSTSFILRCVKEGINVYSYADLYSATKAEGHPIVLQNSINEDFGKINGQYVLESQQLYDKIDTTYDYTYYYNKWVSEGGAADQFEIPQVITLLQFREDLYGNGHIISANNVTYQDPNTKDLKLGLGGNAEAPKDTLFQGPLNFVELVVSEQNKASVKAQDNICFAIYDNVNITDVELKGCDLKAVDENGNLDSTGQIDLGHLNWVGTTVEVLGTNVNITYSRLNSGRTVLRAFGDDEDPQKEIELTVSNCILENAREFIMRIGSNRFVDSADFDNIDNFKAPNLPFELGKDKNGNEQDYNINRLPFTSTNAYSNEVKQRYSSFSDEEKRVYDDAFINTYVTVRDCGFRETGIFAIGIDTHFAGKMLYDGPAAAEKAMPSYKDKFATWYDLAKTSYGAKLRFEGEIWLYNWKSIANIRSETLIEVKVPNGDNANVDENIANLQLDLKQMIATVKGTDQKPGKYPEISTDYDDIECVHAGIAFFGGGKNYSVLEIADGASGMLDSLATYSISLNEAGVSLLEAAGGSESFYFYICSGKTVEEGGFSPAVQNFKLNDPNGKPFAFVERQTDTTN